jgi:acyl carrier protein
VELSIASKIMSVSSGPSGFVTTFDEVVQLIHEKFGVEADALGPTTELTQFGLDSLTLVELIFAIEEHFGVQMPDHADIRNLTDLAMLIDELRSAKTS